MYRAITGVLIYALDPMLTACREACFAEVDLRAAGRALKSLCQKSEATQKAVQSQDNRIPAHAEGLATSRQAITSMRQQLSTAKTALEKDKRVLAELKAKLAAIKSKVGCLVLSTGTRGSLSEKLIPAGRHVMQPGAL